MVDIFGSAMKSMIELKTLTQVCGNGKTAAETWGEYEGYWDSEKLLNQV